METEQYLAFANRFFQAYNEVDFKKIGELVSEDLHWEHHGRFKGEGKERLLVQIREFSQMVPGRYYAEPTRWAVNGDIIFIEHKAHGTPAVDVALFGWKAGEPVTVDFCSLLVLKDGKVVEWSDYA
jgi:ketosteroid isomerase-like protein